MTSGVPTLTAWTRCARDAARAAPETAALWAAALVLRAAFLTGKSLWLDEAMSLVIARAPLAEIPGLVRRNELLPPLHYVLMHF